MKGAVVMELKLDNYAAVAIYGFRKKGKKLYEQLMRNHIRIAYIIERNYEALSILEKKIKIPIIGFCENEVIYRKADVILLSGDLPEKPARECLELAGIHIPVISFEME